MTDPLTLTITREQALDWLHSGELLTLAEAALRAGVSESTIYVWVHRKLLTPYTRNKPRLYRREDVERCADERVANDTHDK